ncbi:hypothetical protein JXM67_01270 [candidate division WOR-3 bacterium]|nr:hypothetical protein [candidate division WOR-3 bacterium]
MCKYIPVITVMCLVGVVPVSATVIWTTEQITDNDKPDLPYDVAAVSSGLMVAYNHQKKNPTMAARYSLPTTSRDRGRTRESLTTTVQILPVV